MLVHVAIYLEQTENTICGITMPVDFSYFCSPLFSLISCCSPTAVYVDTYVPDNAIVSVNTLYSVCKIMHDVAVMSIMELLSFGSSYVKNSRV